MHASKLALNPKVELVAIVDVDAVRAMEAAKVYGARYWSTFIEDTLPHADAYTVAVPIGQLAPVADVLVANGKHVLLEKPGAVSAARLRAIAGIANSRNVVVGVGYLERFNAVSAGLHQGVQDLVAWRAAPNKPRSSGMALDWTCHDVDLAMWLTNKTLSLNAAEVDWEGRLRLCLSGPQGARARLHTLSGRRAVRRRVWADGHKVDLVRVSGDALYDEVAAFINWAQGGARGHLASIDEAVDVLALLEMISVCKSDEVGADGARTLHIK